MTSTDIYSPIVISEQIVKSFKPCRLYIKELAGIKYFGKTSQNPYTYTGSGTIWKDRIKKYGKENIKTLWVSELFLDPQSIHDYALNFSKENQIVESSEWANLQAENGIAGGRWINPGFPGVGKRAAETKRLRGINPGGSSESCARGNQTKKNNGIDVTAQLNTPEIKEKRKIKCAILANRPIVFQLRALVKEHKIFLGSGWISKSDQWILEKIAELSKL